MVLLRCAVGVNLRSCPVDPAFGAGVHVDQHQPLHQGGVVELQQSRRVSHEWLASGEEDQIKSFGIPSSGF